MPGRRREEKTSRIAAFLTAAFLVTALDQISKLIILQTLSPGQSIPVIRSFFHLTLVHNTGIAFGLFRQHPEVLFALITASIIVLFFVGISAAKNDRTSLVCFAFILGGAAGNWLDRVRHEAVIDFFDFRIWPVFNLADAAITLGVVLFIGSRLLMSQQGK